MINFSFEVFNINKNKILTVVNVLLTGDNINDLNKQIICSGTDDVLLTESGPEHITFVDDAIYGENLTSTADTMVI